MDTHIQFSNIKPFGLSVHAEVRREIPDYTEPNLVVNRPKRNPRILDTADPESVSLRARTDIASIPI